MSGDNGARKSGSGGGMGMLAKGLNLLVVLGRHPEGAGASELAREAGINVSTAYRLLVSMVPMGFVRYDEQEHRYTLGLKVFELCHQVPAVRSLSAAAFPLARKIAEKTGEPVSVAVLEGTEMLVVGQAEGRHRIQIRLTAGQRGPLYATSLGKVLLAFSPDDEQQRIVERLDLRPLAPNTITDADVLREELRRTRERGYATVDEENEAGIRAVAVPIKNSSGRAAAALSIAVPTLRASVEDLKGFVPVLREGAEAVEMELIRNESFLVDEERWVRG